METDNEKWPVKQLIKLLRLYGSHRCLWDKNDPFNKNRLERRAAMIDIKEAMGNGMTMEQLAQKINVIRSTYRYEKRRIKTRMKRGLGAKTKLKWFALADAFLRNIPKNDKEKEDNSDLEDTIVFTIDPETLIDELIPENQNYISIGPDELGNSMKDEQISRKNSEINKILDRKTIEDWFSGIKVDSCYEPSLELVKAYQNEECLWNLNSLGFHDEHQRQRSLRIIGSSFEKPLNLKTVELKLKEINFLFKKEMKKEKTGKWFKIAAQFLGTYFFTESQIKQIRKSENTQSDKKWKGEDTLKFVELFKSSPCLWGLDNTHSEDATKAIKSISKEMGWSKEKIKRQVKVLNTTYLKEKEKTLKVSTYKPNLIWFSLVDSFMSIAESAPSSPVNSIKSEALDYPDIQENEIFKVEPQLPRISQDEIKWTPPGDNLLEAKWSLKQSVKFLRLYGSHRCLWDLKDPDYRNKPLRDAALEDIASCMGHGLTAKFVDKKVKIFRITYMQERKRLVDLLKEKKEPEIQLKWFPLADCFLRPHIGLRAFKDSDPELPQFDYQYVFSNLNLIDPELLNSFEGKGSQNFIKIGSRKLKIN